MPFKHKPIIALVLITIPPAVVLAAAAALGWIGFEWSLSGMVYVVGAYAGWIAILAGLAEFFGFLRDKEPGRIEVGDHAQDVAIGEHITQTHKEAATLIEVAGDYIEAARQPPPRPPCNVPPAPRSCAG